MFYLYLAMAALILGYSSAIRDDRVTKKQEREISIFRKCNEKFNVPEENFLYIMSSEDTKIATTTELKCLMNCFLVTLGFMDEDGTMSHQDVMDKFYKEVYAKPENVAGGLEMSRMCKARVDAVNNKCERAYRYLICYMQEANKRSVPAPHADKV